VKARRVKGLKPSGTLADSLERIVATRLDELCSFVPRALDPSRVRELHDMRIAAKRLRYILEVGAEPCFGPYAKVAIKRAKELQDLLGEIHDCDVQLPRVHEIHDELRAVDAIEARVRGGSADDLDPTLASGTPHAEAWRGLETLRIYLEARRGLLFERFLELWRELEREAFRARLEYAIAERPEPAPPQAPPSPDGNGAWTATGVTSSEADDG
jgi:CHAD domain-containing protein